MLRWMGEAVTTHVRGHIVCTGFALKKLMKKRLVLSVLHEIQWWKRHHWQKRAFNPNIKISILILCPSRFPIEVLGKSC